MAIALIRTHKSFSFFILLMTMAAIYILLSPGTSDNGIMNVLTALVAAAGALASLSRLALGVEKLHLRKVWILILSLLSAISIYELLLNKSVSYLPSTVASTDDLEGLALLIASLSLLWLLAKLERLPRLTASILWVGFALQCGSVALDFADSILVSQFRIDSALLQVVIDFIQFLAVQSYLTALVFFVMTLHINRLSHAPSSKFIGNLSRFLFIYAGLYDKLRYPNIARLRLPLIKPAMSIGRFLLWVPKVAPIVREKFGISVLRQMGEIIGALCQHGLDAQSYYMFELYRPANKRNAGGYLTRFETKNGLFSAINGLRPRLLEIERSPLGDKLKFSAMLAEQGLRGVPIIAYADNGATYLPDWLHHPLDTASLGWDQDLFVKPRKSKGARGVGVYRHVAVDQYRVADGRIVTRQQLLQEMAEASLTSPLLIQPRLLNHPALSDLAKDSLIAIRVITCLTQENRPIVTHAMLRVLCKLEPDWPIDVELAAKIDLETGKLGAMTADKKDMACEWFDLHPVTRTGVMGRLVPFWDDIKASAMGAHGLCPDRFIAGWDVACTPNGPVILEGNSFPDVEFLQRVHRASIGDSLLADHLLHNLRRLSLPSEVRGILGWQ